MAMSTSRRQLGLTIGLAGVATVAGWVVVVTSTGAMPMAMMSPTPSSASLFLLAWVAMLLAMMLPALAPMLLTYRRIAASRPRGGLRTGMFVLGYLLVWSAVGGVALALTIVIAQSRLGAGTWSVATAVTLALTGLYQLSPWKASCLRSCRAPLAFFVAHSGGPIKMGALHGAICLGCCWALMTVMVVAGSMSPLWMVVMAVLFIGEKVWRHGFALSRVVGVVAICAAVYVLIA